MNPPTKLTKRKRKNPLEVGTSMPGKLPVEDVSAITDFLARKGRKRRKKKIKKGKKGKKKGSFIQMEPLEIRAGEDSGPEKPKRVEMFKDYIRAKYRKKK